MTMVLGKSLCITQGGSYTNTLITTELGLLKMKYLTSTMTGTQNLNKYEKKMVHLRSYDVDSIFSP
jgi:hypothetical protein